MREEDYQASKKVAQDRAHMQEKAFDQHQQWAAQKQASVYHSPFGAVGGQLSPGLNQPQSTGSAISESIDKFGNSLSETLTRIDNLRNKLDPVMMATPQSGPGTEAVPLSSCKLHADLSSLSNTVRIINEQLGEIQSRLCI